MPNWFYNRVEVSGSESDIAAFKEKHFVDDGKGNKEFTFETVIPMPQILQGIPSSTDVKSLVKRLQGKPVEMWKALAENYGTQMLTEARQSIRAIKETGHADWYTWCNENWGTKWDASEFSLRHGEPTYLMFEFNTAWGPPGPVFVKLKQMHPELGIEIYGYEEQDPTEDDPEPWQPIDPERY